jgi:hypothetical protein
MADDTKPGMAKQARHVYGPRPVGALVPAITRPAFRKRAPAAAQVLADWAAIVGPALAATTAPRRLSAGRLTIACAGPVAMELQHLAPELIARINTYLGRATVSTIGFVQDHQPESPPASPPPPSPAAHAAAARAVKNLPEGPLKEALAALGRSIHAARPPRGRKPSTPEPANG